MEQPGRKFNVEVTRTEKRENVLLPEEAGDVRNPEALNEYGLDKAGAEWVNVTKLEVPSEQQDHSYDGITTYRDLHKAQPGAIGSFTMRVTKKDREKLEAEPRVLTIEPVITTHAINDKTYVHSLEDTNLATFNYGVYIEDRAVEYHELQKLYDLGLKGEGFTVGIIDAGLRETDVKELGSRIVDRRNFVQGEDIYAVNQLHGAWCSRAALPPKAKLVHGKVLDESGSGQASYLVEGLKFLYDSGVDAVGVSIGGSSGRVVEIYENIIGYGARLGIPTFVAAGNAGCTLDAAGSVEAPANSPSAKALAAVNQDTGAVTDFSCCGPEVWLAWSGYKLLVKGLEARAFSGTSMTPWAAIQTYILLKEYSKRSMPEILAAMERGALDSVGTEPRREGRGVGRAFQSLRVFAPPEPKPTPVTPAPKPLPTYSPWRFYISKKYREHCLIDDKKGNASENIPA